MHARLLEPAFDALANQARARARDEGPALDVERLEKLWRAALESMRRQLELDEHLRDACANFENALQVLLLADSEEDYRRAADDLHHHAAMLSDLLASPVPD